ncbi:MAG: hypothetical protein KAJ14_10975 [Candidatus Omnitrophica bacterium]|nr:hypothetical protein [Candidatus Omnitrophota bacterium]
MKKILDEVKQDEILKFIKSFVQKKGYPPSIQEIQNEFKIKSSPTLVKALDELSRKGCLTRKRNLHRAMRITTLTEDNVLDFIKNFKSSTFNCPKGHKNLIHTIEDYREELNKE